MIGLALLLVAQSMVDPDTGYPPEPMPCYRANGGSQPGPKASEAEWQAAWIAVLNACSDKRRERFAEFVKREKKRDPSLSDTAAANNAERMLEEIDQNYYPVFRTTPVVVPIVDQHTQGSTSLRILPA